MQVVLKVIGGKNDGREITISVPEFIIGRGDEAHLRPSSDLISRAHCAIRLADGRVSIQDLGSRNGTFVNGEQLTEMHIARSGDTLRVGRLQFKVLIDPVQAGNKRPKVNSAVEAANRTAESTSKAPASIEESITDWLTDPEDVDLEKQKLRQTETVQFSLEDTSQIAKPESIGETLDAGETEVEDEEKEDDEEEGTDEKQGRKKKEYGKLPPQPKFSHDDSTTAAGDVLKKFFNRR